MLARSCVVVLHTAAERAELRDDLASMPSGVNIEPSALRNLADVGLMENLQFTITHADMGIVQWFWQTIAREGAREMIADSPLSSLADIAAWLELQPLNQRFALRFLSLPRFRNLHDCVIQFSGAYRSHALIGQNGTGKSNLIEALITIFRDIDLDREAPFDYTLEYRIRGHTVRIEAETSKQKRPFVWVDGDRVSQDYLTTNDRPGKAPRDERRGPRLLPTHIFAYYSGRNERIEALFQEHQRRFSLRQEVTAKVFLQEQMFINADPQSIDEYISDEVKRRERLGDDRLRRLFYCRGGHSQLVLLACLLSNDPVFQKVLKNLNIEALESALFVLKEPHRLREKRRNGRLDDEDLSEGDPRFWYARGNVVSEFLDKLWQVAWAPIEQEATKQIDFRGRSEKQKQLYLYVPSQEKLKELGELVGGTDSFFRYAEGAYIGDLIEEVRITVKKRDEHGGKVSFTQLSEGELQMLTVLGLMRITREDNCLFLLDEPDTHLNPIWKLRYFDDIEGVLASDAAAQAQGESQILITTHDPMMIGSLKREQVHILRREGNRTVVDIPDEHPQGMGVTGLLKSELFGLSSTLDIETERRLFRRNELFAIDQRSLEQDDELRRLSAELADLGFSNADFKDPYYAKFVRRMAKHTRFHKPTLTPDEQAEQDKIADAIIAEILSEDASK